MPKSATPDLAAPEAPPLYATEAEALAAPGDVYRHYKGGIYRVLHSNVRHSEDLSTGVVYEHLWPHAHGVWYRPAALFFGALKDGTPRFVRVPF